MRITVAAGLAAEGNSDEIPEIKTHQQALKVAQEVFTADEQQKNREDQWHEKHFNLEKLYVFRLWNALGFDRKKANTDMTILMVFE